MQQQKEKCVEDHSAAAKTLTVGHALWARYQTLKDTQGLGSLKDLIKIVQWKRINIKITTEFTSGFQPEIVL